MTRPREVETGFWPQRFLAAAVVLLALGACASLPQDQPVYEQLDPDTGLTLTRIGKPLELYREAVQAGSTDRFAFLAPFETNLMGTREHFLWLAVPMDPALNTSVPTLEADGTLLELGTAGRDADFAGLTKPPYKTPLPWSALYYFRLDAALVARLGAAQSLIIRSVEPAKNGDGTVATEYTLNVGDDPRLREYAAR